MCGCGCGCGCWRKKLLAFVWCSNIRDLSIGMESNADIVVADARSLYVCSMWLNELKFMIVHSAVTQYTTDMTPECAQCTVYIISKQQKNLVSCVYTNKPN